MPYLLGKKQQKRPRRLDETPIEKAPSGIAGLDEITNGGLPKARPTLVCGGAGCGKTLLAVEFLVHGATRLSEPGVFVSFEETDEELARNVATLGFQLSKLVKQGKLHIDYIHLDTGKLEEIGAFDLEGLFIRLGHAIDSIGARRVVVDSIESLFSAIPSESILRAELARLFRWLKSRGVTALITAERGDNLLTRHGLEEYVADCVLLLDHRVDEQVSTRRLRVVKYRGSTHGTNEYPFVLDKSGFSVLPITSMEMDYPSSTERVSSGVKAIDRMLGGRGFFRGSSILLSGTAGTGKSSLAAHFVDAACARGERAMYFGFEESGTQIVRNMRSIGIDLDRWVRKELLEFHTVRPSVYGLETHLASAFSHVSRRRPSTIVVDPVTAFDLAGADRAITSMLTRLIDHFKRLGITTLFTGLARPDGPPGQTEVSVSSLMDTWILLRNVENGGVRTRDLFVLKSRGMAHSNEVSKFALTDHGVQLLGNSPRPPSGGVAREGVK